MSATMMALKICRQSHLRVNLMMSIPYKRCMRTRISWEDHNPPAKTCCTNITSPFFPRGKIHTDLTQISTCIINRSHFANFVMHRRQLIVILTDLMQLWRNSVRAINILLYELQTLDNRDYHTSTIGRTFTVPASVF